MPSLLAPYARLAEADDAEVRKHAGLRGAALEKLKAQGFDLAPYNSALARFPGLHRDSADATKKKVTNSYIAKKREVPQAMAEMLRRSTGKSVQAAKDKRPAIIQDVGEAEQPLARRGACAGVLIVVGGASTAVG